VSDSESASVDSPSQTASRDSSTSAGNSSSAEAPDVATEAVDDVTSHRLLADQPEVVRQLVGTMMSKWNARASDVSSAAMNGNDGTIQLDVLEVDGNLASSVMPQVRRALRMRKRRGDRGGGATGPPQLPRLRDQQCIGSRNCWSPLHPDRWKVHRFLPTGVA